VNSIDKRGIAPEGHRDLHVAVHGVHLALYLDALGVKVAAALAGIVKADPEGAVRGPGDKAAAQQALEVHRKVIALCLERAI